MKTQKRFNPAVLTRFIKEGRGTGTFNDYIAWHKVSRSDPSSRGRSHIQKIHGRQHDLLSDAELLFLMFATMLTNLVDCREQFPLSSEWSTHELTSYSILAPNGLFPGTSHIAEILNFRHPKCRGDGKSAPWVPTTDLLLTLRKGSGIYYLIAIAIKKNRNLSKREKQLLEIERQYWTARGVLWVLLVPDLCHPLVIDLLSCTRGWALSPQVDNALIENAVKKSEFWNGKTLTDALNNLNSDVNDFSLSQNIFWQAVWRGKIRLDLRRGWRPHEPLKILSEDDFKNLNPISTGCTAWT